MDTKQSSWDDMATDIQKANLGDVVEKTLEIMGDPAKHFIIDRLENHYKLKIKSLSTTSWDELEEALTDMFGFGAKILLKRIEAECGKLT